MNTTAVLPDPGAPSPAAAAARSERTRRALESLRVRVDGWFGDRRDDSRWARFTAHFRVLSTVLDTMLSALGDRHDAIRAGDLPSGQVYFDLRVIDDQIDIVRRIFDWYAEKYEQRGDPSIAGALAAADEIVRSCWTGPFVKLRRPRMPPGPLTYLDARYDAAATPRQSLPTDLRAPSDAVVAEFIRQLPIPVIALPQVVAADPWWAVLAAHETGHHLQYDLDPGLVGRTRAVLLDADAALGVAWSGWALEAFADAVSVLWVGPAATWAVAEMQHATADRLGRPPAPGDRYPPPPVRLALMGEIARRAGFPDPVPALGDVRDWCDAVLPPGPARATIGRHLDVVPEVAAALLTLEVDGVDLATLCLDDPAAYRPGGRVDRWTAQLATTAPRFTERDRRPAARWAIAAGVQAHLEEASPEEFRSRRTAIGANLKTLLTGCGPEGVLAGAGAPDVAGLAAELTGALLSLTPEP